MDYKIKRNIIIAAVIVILAILAVVGIASYVRSDSESQASSELNGSEGSETTNGQTNNNQVSDDNDEVTNSVTETETTTEITNTTSDTNETNTSASTNTSSNTTTNSTNSTNTSTTSNTNINTNTNNTTTSTTTEVVTENVEKQVSTTETVIKEEEEILIGFNTISLKSKLSASLTADYPTVTSVVEEETDEIAPVVNYVADDGTYKKLTYGKWYNKELTIWVIDETENLDTITLYIFDENDSVAEIKEIENGYTLDTTGKYVIKAKDTAGNETTMAIRIDLEAPVIEGVEDGEYYNTVTPVVTDNFGKYTITLTKDGEEIDYIEGTAITEDGVYTITAVDRAGNEAETITFTVDATAPEIESIGIVNYAYFKGGIKTYSTTGDTIRIIVRFKEELETAPTITIVGEAENYEYTLTGSKSTYTLDVTIKEGKIDLSEGLIEFIVSGYADKAGNIGETISNIENIEYIDQNYPEVIYDTIDPEITITPDGGIFNESPLDVTVTIDEENIDTIEYIWSGWIDIDKINSDASHVWTSVDESELNSDGEFIITRNTIDAYLWVKVTDKVGNVTYKMSSEKFLIDTEAPTIAIDAENSVGNLNDSNRYSEIGFTLTDNYGIVSYIINDTAVTINGTRVKEYTISYDEIKEYLIEGEENTIYVTDIAGNISEEITFIYDSKTPTLKGVDFYTNGNNEDKVYYATTGNKIVLNARFDEELAKVPTFTLIDEEGNRVTVEGKFYDWTGKNGSYMYQISYIVPSDTKLVDGEITFEISNIVDLAGNEYESVITTTSNGKLVILDTTDPTIYVRGQNDLGYVNSDFTIQVQDDNKFTVKVYNENGEVINTVESKTSDESWGWKKYYASYSIWWKRAQGNLPDGEYTVVATDIAGNTSEKTIIIDTTCPEVVNTSYDPETKTNGSVIVTVTFDEEVQLPDGWEYADDTKTVISKTYDENTDGDVKFNVYDLAGNSSEVTVNVSNIDRIAPEPTAVYIYGGDDDGYVRTGDNIRVVLHFNEELAVAPTITIGNKSIVASVTKTNGIYAYYADFIVNEALGLTEGTVTFVASGYKDEAGNVGEDVKEAKNKTLIYDETAPTISEASVVSTITSVNITVEDESTTPHTKYTKTISVADGYTSTEKVNVIANTGDAAYIYITETDSTSGAKWTEVTNENTANTYAYTLASSAEGEHTIYVFAKDDAGNIAKCEVTITLDKTAPTITASNGHTIASGETYEYNVSSSNKFTGTATDSSGIALILMNNKIREKISTSSGVTYKIVDKAGNIGTYVIK